MSIVQELYQTFKHIEFNEDLHSYTDKRDRFKYTSVTTIKKKYVPPVDWDYWKTYKMLQKIGKVKYRYDLCKHRSFEFNDKIISFEEGSELVDIDIITQEWKEKADEGKENGTRIHKYIEDAWKNKYPLDRIEEIDHIINIQSKTMSPLGLEVVIGDREIGIAGQFDGLFLTNKGEIHLRDTKTDAKMKSAFQGAKLLPPFHLTSASTLGEYSIQLNLYKHIIEYNTNIKIDKLYIDHFNKEMAYKEYRINDLRIDYDAFRRNFNAA